MFAWVANRFKGSNQPANIEFDPDAIDPALEAEIIRMIEQEEQNLWLFIVALAAELYPGDNSGVERVEKAVSKALDKIA